MERVPQACRGLGLGSTGYQPVAPGNMPDGTEEVRLNQAGDGFLRRLLHVPVGW